MATYRRCRYLVAYGICDDGRLGRVHQTAKGTAGRPCYSVVGCYLPAGENVPLRWELEELIGPGSTESC